MGGTADIGVVGLGVMGRSLALNIAGHGFTVAAFDRDRDQGARLSTAAAARTGQTGPIVPASDLSGFVDSLKRPRAILLMVPAGQPVDDGLQALLPLLARDDAVIDGGNSHYRDTMRRAAAMAERGLLFVGLGVSGGEAGALTGPSLMAGGPRAAYQRVEPILTTIAARTEGRICLAWLGSDGAGHFVKTVHNGIEYADMQAIAEIYGLMRAAGMAAAAMAAIFARWNQGELESFLIEITADILTRKDEATGRPMVELIQDRAQQKGTGQWASVAALELGVPAPAIAEAVFARTLSARKAERVAAAGVLGGAAVKLPTGEGFLADLHDAMLTARLASYAQGLALIDAARRAHEWQTDLSTIGTIWQGGCIIRARLLDAVRAAYGRDPDLPNLLMADEVRPRLLKALPGLGRVVALAASHGVPVPLLASSLAYVEGYRTAELPANLIQAQRDYFGAHTIERTDRPGSIHLDWAGLPK
ncbi:MAG: NADP-dependent phosphogluconate dehydrogenase [Alphaproteobacteria bacterium]|nr:NADP-dependent phosphogluconate dehydrogenase [Alphaproteobacteria bacterium]